MGKGVLTCKGCGGRSTNLEPRGPARLNVSVCSTCGSDDLDYVYDVPACDVPKEKATKKRAAIDCEGFDYAFRSYSSFKDVNDARFHELREAYVKAADALAAYVGLDDA